jgi:ribosomal protein S27E
MKNKKIIIIKCPRCGDQKYKKPVVYITCNKCLDKEKITIN